MQNINHIKIWEYSLIRARISVLKPSGCKILERTSCWKQMVPFFFYGIFYFSAVVVKSKG
jgi:hypothetical protein